MTFAEKLIIIRKRLFLSQEALAKELFEAGEYFAAELVDNTDRTPLYRYARAQASYLAHAEMITVFDPPDGREYSKNLWSPELHYYYAEDFPEEDFDEGWY